MDSRGQSWGRVLRQTSHSPMATSLTTVLIGTWFTLGECCSVCSHARARRAPRVLGVAPTQLSTANGDGSSPACDSEGQRRCWPTRTGRQSSSILDSDHRRPGDSLCVPYTKEPVRVCADGPFRFPCYLPTTSLLNPNASKTQPLARALAMRVNV